MKHLKKLATTLNKNCLSFIATLALFVTYNGVNTACWFVMNQDELPKGSKKLRNNDSGTCGCTDTESNQKIDDRATGSDCCQCLTPNPVSHNNRIYCII